MHKYLAKITRLRTEARAAGVYEPLWSTMTTLVSVAVLLPFVVTVLSGGRA